jgi:NAD(P)-dependent dehydrogenase (short-subunit alcohol dehydrogenase family)
VVLARAPRAVVTGAASGLGRAFCLVLADRGAKVLASDVDLAGAEATCRLALARGAAAAIARRCDVGSADDVEALADAADEELGGADLIVNNAGVAASGLIGQTPLEDWRWLLDVNLWGVVHGCHVFVPRCARRGAAT